MKQLILNVRKLDNCELFNELSTCKYPIDWMSDHLWASWTKRLIDNKYKTCKMRLIANCLDMDWPFNKNKEKANDYVSVSWSQIMNCPLQLQRKIIKCIAAITLVDLNQTEMAVEHLKFIDNYRNNKKGRNHINEHKIFKFDKLIKSHFFDQLYRSEEPLLLLSKGIWSDLTSHLTISKFRTFEIKLIADFLGLDWPVARKDELISDYILVGLSELLKMSPPCRKVLVVCVAAIIVTEKSELEFKLLIDDSTSNYGIYHSDIDKFHRKLVVSVNPESLVTRDLWEEWSCILTNNAFGNEIIYKFAKKNGLIWPKSKQNETFECYLSRSFDEISKVLGSEAKRTLILCVAKAAYPNNL